jgi:hypothetical protein
MFRYRLVDQRVPAMCRSLAAARLSAKLPSGRRRPRACVGESLAYALERIVGSDAAPVLLRKRVVRQGLGHGRLDQLGSALTEIVTSSDTLRTSLAHVRLSTMPSR